MYLELLLYGNYVMDKSSGRNCISLRRQYPVVVHALERLQNQGDDKAGQFLASIMRFQFIIALVIAEHIYIALLSVSIPPRYRLLQ